jgi:hypothetical protein
VVSALQIEERELPDQLPLPPQIHHPARPIVINYLIGH